MKRIILLILVFFLGFSFLFKVKAGVFEPALLDESFYKIDREMRAVWVTPLVGDIARFQSEAQYKNELKSVLNKMEKYNLNTLFFHVRIYNDALYESSYNNWSSYYSTNPSWDMLPWLIEECHSRGIEFHAWMNPYRVATSGNKTTIASKFPKTNPASNPDNLLVGSGTTILNPGIPEVQQFLVTICAELINKYDVDGIHFDDYFYIDGMESDNDTYVKYGSGEGIEQFRRNSVDKFIELLHKRLVRFYKETGKVVQLGISPTPVWANGDGVVTYDDDGKAITSGSNTKNSQGHYGNYHYCDTLKWINEEWIDYICPQCYVGVNNGNENFYRECEWWSKVCEKKPCRVVIGIGLYRAGSKADWHPSLELQRELAYMKEVGGIDGFAIFSYKQIDEYDEKKKANLDNASEYMSGTVLPIEVDYYKEETPAEPNILLVKEDNVTKLILQDEEKAKFYCILKEEDNNVSLVKITNIRSNEECLYQEEYNEDVTYYVSSIKSNNQMSYYKILPSDNYYNHYRFFDRNKDLITNYYAKVVTEYPIINIPGATVTWEQDGNDFYLHLDISIYNVKYLVNGNLFEEMEIEYGNETPNIPCELTGYDFLGWDGLVNSIESDLVINARLVPLKYDVCYYVGNVLVKTEKYNYDEVVKLEYVYPRSGYSFDGYYLNEEKIEEIIIKQNYDIYLKYTKLLKVYHINYDLDGGEFDGVATFEFDEDHLPTLPKAKKEGFEFVGWMENGKIIKNIGYRDYNLIATYKEIKEENIEVNNGCQSKLTGLFISFGLIGIFVLRRRKYE